MDLESGRGFVHGISTTEELLLSVMLGPSMRRRISCRVVIGLSESHRRTGLLLLIPILCFVDGLWTRVRCPAVSAHTGSTRLVHVCGCGWFTVTRRLLIRQVFVIPVLR